MIVATHLPLELPITVPDLHSSNIDHLETFEVHLCLIPLVVIGISGGSEVCPADRM